MPPRGGPRPRRAAQCGALHRAVFIDALGTMVRLRPPWERIDPALVDGIPAERVRAGFAAEIAFYMDHLDEGRDPESLVELRRRCAAVLSREIGREISAEAMMAAIGFEPFDDAAPALGELRELGLRVVCVSNWDCSLPEVLERAGLGALLDGVVTSASAGAQKPDPAIFAPALELAGCSPAEAIHVGDGPGDVAAARAAGIEVLRIDRSGHGDIAALGEIVEHLRQ